VKLVAEARCTVREPRGRGTSAVGSRYQATTGEGNRLRRLSTALVNCRVCEVAIAL
jgi:hypothetical protein